MFVFGVGIRKCGGSQNQIPRTKVITCRCDARRRHRALVVAPNDDFVFDLILKRGGFIAAADAAFAAAAAASEVAEVPIVAQITVASGGLTREGVPAADVARRLQEAGADVVGVNCSEPLAGLDALLEMRAATDLPLIGQPAVRSVRAVLTGKHSREHGSMCRLRGTRRRHRVLENRCPLGPGPQPRRGLQAGRVGSQTISSHGVPYHPEDIRRSR